MRVPFPTVAIACGLLLSSAPAAAQTGSADDAPHGMVAIGAGVAPDHDGSEDVRPIPFALADVRWGGVNLEIRGLRARADLVSDPRLSFGPVVGPRLDRRDVDGPIGLLPEIDIAIEAGAYLGYRVGGDQLGQGSLQMEFSMVHDVSQTHNGLLATASAGYAAARQADVFVTLDVQTTWTTADYGRTYFGIEPDDAVASGLPAFRPGSGFRDVGAGLTAGYWFDRHFGVIGRASATYLVGDIADSLVTDQGSRWQPAAGLALS